MNMGMQYKSLAFTGFKIKPFPGKGGHRGRAIACFALVWAGYILLQQNKFFCKNSALLLASCPATRRIGL
jgi:hypothetical protein